MLQSPDGQHALLLCSYARKDTALRYMLSVQHTQEMWHLHMLGKGSLTL